MERKRRTQPVSCIYRKWDEKYIPPPDRELFKLRYWALLLNADFKAFCESNTDKEGDILSAWDNIQEFMMIASHFEKCLLFYGNIFNKDFGFIYTRFQESFYSYIQGLRPFPFKKLIPGEPVPAGVLSLAFDPGLSIETLRKLFDSFLKAEKRKAKGIKADLPGYLTWNKSTTDLRQIEDFLIVYDMKKSYPNTWKRRAVKWLGDKKRRNESLSGAELISGKKRTPESFERFLSLPPESLERILRRYAKAGENLSFWALRGIFPKTTK